MNELQVFNNNEFGQLRTINIDGKDYFVGKDIALALGYAIPSKAINTHCKGVSKMEVPTNGGIQQMLMITEGDIYRLITHSKLPNAEKFEEWVFDEVLPSIRKHGMYATENTIDNILNDPDFGIRLLTELKEEKAKRKAVEEENKNNKPKVIFADAVATSQTSILVGELAKILKQNDIEIGEKRLFKWLRNNGYLIKRNGSDYNMPTQKSVDLGVIEIKERAINNPDGSVRVTKTPKVTGKGQQYFINKFLNNKEEQ